MVQLGAENSGDFLENMVRLESDLRVRITLQKSNELIPRLAMLKGSCPFQSRPVWVSVSMRFFLGEGVDLCPSQLHWSNIAGLARNQANQTWHHGSVRVCLGRTNPCHGAGASGQLQVAPVCMVRMVAHGA